MKSTNECVCSLFFHSLLKNMAHRYSFLWILTSEFFSAGTALTFSSHKKNPRKHQKMKGSLLFNWISQCQPRLTILLLIWGIAYNDSFNIFVLIVSKYLNHHKESFPLRQYLINDPTNLYLRHHKESSPQRIISSRTIFN